ncbi:MAG: hypothetical protein KDK72_01235 [Chlamydiia bacterium]|nr:hypothetical protein [Chlamydiia bacterium]
MLKKKATTGTAKILLEAIQLEDTNFIRYLIENKAHTKENTPEIAFDIITLAAQKECVGNRQFHILCSAINIRDHKDKIDDTFLRKINTIEKIDTLLLVVNKPSWPYCATITFSQEISENILSNEKYKNAFESKVAEFSYDPQTHLHIAQFFNRCETAFFIAIEKGDEKNVEKHMFNRFFTNSDKDPVMVAFQHNVSDTILKILLDRKLQQKENEAHQKQIEQYISYAIEHNRVEPFLRIVQSQPPLFKKRTMEQLIRQASDNVARYPFIKALLPADSTLTNGKTDRHWVEVLIKSDDHLSFEESTKIHLLNIATYSEKVVGESVSRLMTDYNMLPEIKAPPLLLMKIDSLLGNPLFQQEAYKANSQLGEKVLLSLYAVDPEENSNISAFVDKKIEQDETNITNKVKNRDEHWIEVCCCSKNKGAQLLRSELINEIQRYDPENQASRESLSTLYSNIRSSLTLKHIVDAEVLYETYKAGPLHLRFLIQDSLGQSEIFYYPHEMLFQKKDRLIEFYNLLVGEDEKTIDFLFEISFAITNFWRPPAYSNLWPTKDCDKFRVDLRRRLLPLSCNQHWVLILSEAARNATITPEEYAEMLAKSPLFIPDESEDNTLTIDKDLLIPITLIHEKDRKEQIVAVIRQMLEAKDNISEQGRQRWADFVKNQESFLQK